jgi:hypothetical protein
MDEINLSKDINFLFGMVCQLLSIEFQMYCWIVIPIINYGSWYF